jgi:hypothetical protein
MLSVGHRPSLRAFHTHLLHLGREGQYDMEMLPVVTRDGPGSLLFVTVCWLSVVVVVMTAVNATVSLLILATCIPVQRR